VEDVSYPGAVRLSLRVAVDEGTTRNQLRAIAEELVKSPVAHTEKTGSAIADQIARLPELHQSGALSDDDFADAKRRLISGS